MAPWGWGSVSRGIFPGPGIGWRSWASMWRGRAGGRGATSRWRGRVRGRGGRVKPRRGGRSGQQRAPPDPRCQRWVAVIGTCPHLSAAHNPGGSDAQIAGRGAQNDASSPNVATPESAGSERAPRRPSAPTPATAPGHGIPTSFLTTPYRAVGANRRTVYATGQQARTKITMAVATPLAPLTRRAVTHRCA